MPAPRDQQYDNYLNQPDPQGEGPKSLAMWRRRKCGGPDVTKLKKSGKSLEAIKAGLTQPQRIKSRRTANGGIWEESLSRDV